MRLTKKYERRFANPHWEGRAQGFKIQVAEKSEGVYYFTCNDKDNKGFNSLWNDWVYESLEAVAEAIKSIKLKDLV